METPSTSAMERLWTPWRMQYISGEAKEDGCIFCNRLAAEDDVTCLILYRAEHSFVIMNLFPYNTGHVMLVPNEHAADPEELDLPTLREMGELLPLLTRSLRRVFACAGFNVGLNIGAVAGAGVAAHLHQHIVPRWQGDANFMPILASTMAIPEMIPSTYAKIRAELHRELTGSVECTVVLLDSAAPRVLTSQGRLPRAPLAGDEPVWQTALKACPDGIESMAIGGWAGATQAIPRRGESLALTLWGTPSSDLPDGWSFVDVSGGQLAHDDQEIVTRALRQLAPAVGA